MNYTQDPHRMSVPFGNPFRRLMPKGSSLSPKLLGLLNPFEEGLAQRIEKLKPSDPVDVVSLTWMRSAMKSLCELHVDVKSLITALELPVSDWDDKWIDVYLDNSIKLLDISIAFSSEISRLKQGHLFLQCVLHNLRTGSSTQFVRAHSSLDGWKQHIRSKNPRLDNCFSVLDSLAQTLDLPKIKNSAKGRVLMRAMYGVKAVTLLVCSIFAAAFSGSTEKLMEQVPDKCLWAEAFTNLQAFVNVEVRNACSNGSVTTLKELETVNAVVKKLHPMVQDGLDSVNSEELQECTSDLEYSAERFSHGLDLLAKEVDSFFQVVLTGRDALVCSLRVGSNVPDKVRTSRSVKSQAVR